LSISVSGSNYYTFLTKSFDRIDTKEIIHYASALTMSGYVDGGKSIRKILIEPMTPECLEYDQLGPFRLRNMYNIHKGNLLIIRSLKMIRNGMD
jgi:hypothetical protein